MSAHKDFKRCHELLDMSEAELLQADPVQVDEAWADSGEKLERFAWRAVRDRWYRHVVHQRGLHALTVAGFVDDRSTAPSLRERFDSALLTTPVHLAQANLAHVPDGQVPVVILSTGAYSPIHPGHLAVLEGAREQLEQAGRCVIAGYLSASHDNYVQRKGIGHRTAEERLLLAEVACAGSDWIMSDPWEARYVGTSINFTEVVEHLQTYLHHHLGREVEVWYAFGSDNAGFAYTFAQKGHCICVVRSQESSPLDEVLQDHAVERAQREGRMLVVPATDHAEASSTQIRSAGVHPDKDVAQHMERLSSATAGWYALRDDLDLATRHWGITSEHLQPALATFADRVQKHIHHEFERAHADVHIKRLSVVKQYEQLAQSTRHPLIHLDVWALDMGADTQLDLCRNFHMADGQVRANSLAARPESSDDAATAAQLIPAGEYTLVDDDIATGYTVSQAKQMLGHCQIRDCVSLLQLSREAMQAPGREVDIVDLRDFLVAARYGGLVCDGLRVPYMQPYVRLAARAMTPPASEMRLSLALWKANLELHRTLGEHGHALTVADCPPPQQALWLQVGLTLQTSLAQVCAWHIEHLTKLPFQVDAKLTMQTDVQSAQEHSTNADNDSGRPHRPTPRVLST